MCIPITKYITIIVAFLSLTACTVDHSQNEAKKAPRADFSVGEKSYSVTLKYENFMNADGLVNRILSVEYPNKATVNHVIHVAHYSDEVQLKKIEISGRGYLIAEDKTGYTLLDLNKMKIISQSQDMEKNDMVDEPIGTAEDFMTHKALTNGDWTKVLKVNKIEDSNVTQLVWK
ncbi:hypothetical protein K3G39_20095 [Pontibacter sp. HSC-14F20]|uniref:hypothetical protein n=1 Tax=Pontibacter sp. HSC-14F20 TaxID=2864136 RepID=UPI001C730E2F|nr:hypothetical protein [Pontibacter sp. HSC-14F20]MBX0335539.1 hypothetical protein [Pontibacter sp. HSC-14F20]